MITLCAFSVGAGLAEAVAMGKVQCPDMKYSLRTDVKVRLGRKCWNSGLRKGGDSKHNEAEKGQALQGASPSV